LITKYSFGYYFSLKNKEFDKAFAKSPLVDRQLVNIVLDDKNIAYTSIFFK
jgi:hypothetical protein